MLIIKIKETDNNLHHFQSQSHRTECWIDGYIAVPKELESIVYSCRGYCELIIENGVLVNVMPHTECIPKVETPMSETELTTNDMAAAILEGVNEV